MEGNKSTLHLSKTPQAQFYSGPSSNHIKELTLLQLSLVQLFLILLKIVKFEQRMFLNEIVLFLTQCKKISGYAQSQTGSDYNLIEPISYICFQSLFKQNVHYKTHFTFSTFREIPSKSKYWSERSACAALGCWHKRRWPL